MLDMSWIGYALIMLNTIGIAQHTWPNLLIPLGGNLPNTAEGYHQLLALVRRNEHYRRRSTYFDANHPEEFALKGPHDDKSQYHSGTRTPVLDAPFAEQTAAEDDIQSVCSADSESSASQFSAISLKPQTYK